MQTTAPVTFDVTSSDNSAIAGSDYVAIGAGVTGSIAAGTTTTTITVNINNDYIKKEMENFNVTLSNVSTNVDLASSDLVGVGTINDGSTVTVADTVYAHISVDAAKCGRRWRIDLHRELERQQR